MIGAIDISRTSIAGFAMLAAAGIAATPLSGRPKKKKRAPGQTSRRRISQMLDLSKIVWPQPPSIARVKYMTYYSGEKLDLAALPAAKKKASWMDRLAGAQTEKEKQELQPTFS